MRDLLAVFRTPRSLIAGLAIQALGAPLVALAVNDALDPPLGLALGLILVAAVPGGTMSNVLTYVARGNIALSIALTAITTLGSLVVTPMLLRILMAAHLPAAFVMPTRQVAVDIFACLLGPLGLGMMAGRAFPGIQPAFTRWCIRGSLLIIGAIIVGAAGAGRLDPHAYGWAGPALIGLFAVAIQQVARLVLLALGAPRRDLVAIGIEVTIRNTNLGLLIKASLFPAIAGAADPIADGVLFVVLLYGGLAVPACLPLFALGRRGAMGGAAMREAAGARPPCP
jgi:BASS family bile acid:Na+ symporter